MSFQKGEIKQSQPPQSEKDIKEVTERLAATSTKSSGWGWGWGVDSLLSTATAGISTITSQVSQVKYRKKIHCNVCM